jgi:hypothetical protein
VHSVRVSRKYFGARQRAFDRSGPITPQLSYPREREVTLTESATCSLLVQMELVEFHVFRRQPLQLKSVHRWSRPTDVTPNSERLTDGMVDTGEGRNSGAVCLACPKIRTAIFRRVQASRSLPISRSYLRLGR